MKYHHIPVLLKEVLEAIQPKEGDYLVDCTLGGAGYTLALAQKVGATGKVLSIDLDDLAIKNAEEEIRKRKIKNIILVRSNFSNIASVAEDKFKDKKVQGIVMDLGLSSAQLDDEKRGFSFQKNTPLNMNFGYSDVDTGQIISQWSEKDLIYIFKEYGEEKFARLIAKKIVFQRKIKPIKTTNDLVELIKGAVPKNFKEKIHPATRAFQALRIATNNELQNLEKALEAGVSVLAPEGKIAIVSYHSLEDRIIKHFFKSQSQDCVCPKEIPICACNNRAKLKVITKKPILPSAEEIARNPRARSAKLRVAEKK